MKNVSHRTFIYSLLACSLMMTMAGCQKCSSPKIDGGKDGYVMILDGLCTQTKTKADSMQGEFKAAFEKGDSETVNAITDRLNALFPALMQEMKKVAQPSEDAATLKDFWAESDKYEEINGRFVTQFKKVNEMNAAAKHAAENEPAKEPSEGDEEDAADAPDAAHEEEAAKAPDTAGVAAANAELERIGGELQAQKEKIATLAKKYGFKVCGIPSAQK